MGGKIPMVSILIFATELKRGERNRRREGKKTPVKRDTIIRPRITGKKVARSSIKERCLPMIRRFM